MCLIAFAWNVHPRWPLILAANRDEQHARPTAALAAWDDLQQIRGGRDLREGGGWLALNFERRRLAAVTNVREPAHAAARLSRGALVRDFAAGSECGAGFAQHLAIDAPAYGPFNLLLWDGTELVYSSNRPNPRWESLRAGVHGLSNGSLEAHWPKVRHTVAALRAWLPQLPDGDELPAEASIEPLMRALADDRPVADAELPDTGVGLAMERLLAPPFIRGETYGTRASSVVLLGRREALFAERRFGPGGIALGADTLRLSR